MAAMMQKACKYVSLNGNIRILNEILLECVSKSLSDNKSSLFRIMDWRQTGDKLFHQPVTSSLLTHDTYMRHSASMR